MADGRTGDQDDRLATFIMLYQEPVGSHTRPDPCESTHTRAREQVDHLELGTRTDTEARETGDPTALAHATFGAIAATKTFSESRENVDSDVSSDFAVFAAKTKTSEREQEDADVRAPFSAMPRGIETQTHSKDAREQADPDITQCTFTTFPLRA